MNTPDVNGIVFFPSPDPVSPLRMTSVLDVGSPPIAGNAGTLRAWWGDVHEAVVSITSNPTKA